jgi:hypothetical protein
MYRLPPAPELQRIGPHRVALPGVVTSDFGELSRAVIRHIVLPREAWWKRIVVVIASYGPNPVNRWHKKRADSARIGHMSRRQGKYLIPDLKQYSGSDLLKRSFIVLRVENRENRLTQTAVCETFARVGRSSGRARF